MKIRHFIIPGLLLTAGIALIVISFTSRGARHLSPEEVAAMINTDTSIIMLDVRMADEYRSETGQLAHAMVVPVQELEERIDELAPFKDRIIITYCRSGRRSSKAADILSARGFRTLSMDGGILKWRELNLPVVNEDDH